MEKELMNLFDKPKIIAIVGNVGEAKSNTLYYLLDYLGKNYNFNLYTYGLRYDITNAIRFNSVQELEQIQNSLIIIDEVMSLWDLDDRKIKKQIENTLRMIEHNNNIMIISAIPENLKKFICGKIKAYIFKACTHSDFINGSGVKNVLLNYRGEENGSTMFNIDKDKALLFDGHHYYVLNIPYMEEFDSKSNNKDIFQVKLTIPFNK
jgi:hypothetical protein